MEERHNSMTADADERPRSGRNNAVSRREMLRLTGYGTMGLALAALTADGAGAAPSRLERMLPGVRELRGPSVALQSNPGPTQMQTPFFGPGWSLPQNYKTILFADFDGDGKPELLARSPGGIVAYQYDTVAKQFRSQFLDPTFKQWIPMPPGPVMSDGAFPVDANNNSIPTPFQTSFEHPRYYETIRAADIDGDGQAELLARWWDGVYSFHWGFDTNQKLWGWTRMTVASPPWSDEAGWTYPRYYETIRTGDFDGDGQAEIVGRGKDGIEAWKYDPSSQSWAMMPQGGSPSLWSDAEGWGAPQKYRTIRVADIDGDGKDELIGRGSGGIFVYKYSESDGWQPLGGVAGPVWSDAAGFDKPQYYETIRTADIDGDGSDELLIRGKNGLQAAKYVQGAWVNIPNPIGFWGDNEGYNNPQYYETIRAADVNGDGVDEMLIRNGSYLETWGYVQQTSQPQREWQRLKPDMGPLGPPWSDFAGWDVQQYYESIQFANIDGLRSPSGHPFASAFGIGPSGVEIWRLDAPITNWERPTARFPEFAGAALTAYQYLSKKLAQDNFVVDIRSLYDDAEATDEQTWHDNTLPNMAPAPGVPLAVWKEVKGQIVTELGFVLNVKASADQIHSSQSDTEGDKSLKLTFVSGLLQTDNINSYNAQAAAVAAAQAQNAETDAIIGSVLGATGAMGGFTGFPIAPALTGAYAFFKANGGAQIWDETVSGPVFDSAIYVKTSELANYLAQSYDDFLGGQAGVQSLVMGDYGLLQATGSDFLWSATDMNAVRQRGVDAFTLWLWQTLTPLIWRQKYESPGEDFSKYLDKHDYPHDAAWEFSSGRNGFWIQAESPGNKAVKPQSESLHNIFNSPDIDDNGVNHGGLGVSVFDAYLRYGGWNLPGDNVSHAAALSDKLCGGSKTEAAGDTLPIPPSAPEPGEQWTPRLVIMAESKPLENGLITTQIGLHNRTNAIISHVEITEATLTLPGIGRRKVKPMEALPSRRQRLARGKWALVDLTFPIPASDTGGFATVQVRGTYITRRPNRKPERTSFGGTWRNWPI